MSTKQRPRVTLRRSHLIEVGGPDRRGRPSYHWVQGWTYTTPSGHDAGPFRLSDARHFARLDYPGAAVVFE